MKTANCFTKINKSYLGKSRGTQTQDQHHRTFSNLILRRKVQEAIWFFCERDTGGFLIPGYWVTDIMGFMNKTVAEVLVGKHPLERKSHCSTFKFHEVTPIFIPVGIK